MEGVELEEGLRNCPRLPVWIIEYVWAHRVMDIRQVVDPSLWPDVDSQPLSLEDSWRLRVSSARAFSIVRKRDFPRFESVIGFLEATHRLVPGLVKAIRHMKVLFGLKTLVVMRMLRDGQSSIDTSLKIQRFFPTDLPQYHGQCSPREMFLMRKNQLDFRVLAQILTTDNAKRQYYVKNQLDQQYGEAYAQKVEERLLQYLQQLESVLPRDTRVDQVRRKSPESEEERLLLRVSSWDAGTIATTLERLLRCDAASRRQVSRPSEVTGGSEPPPVPLVPQNSGAVRDSEKSCSVAPCQHCSSSSSSSSSSSPQFCSRHRRWVQTILSPCPTDSSDPVPRSGQPVSPLLFLSSPSSSSSSDRTLSGLQPPRRPQLILRDDSPPLDHSSPRPGPSTSARRSLVTSSDPGSSRSPESEPSSRLSPNRTAPPPSSEALGSPVPEPDSEAPGWTGSSVRLDPDCRLVRSRADQQVQPRLSVRAQQVLLQSTLLQPRVSISRLEVPDRYRPVSPADPGSSDDTQDQDSCSDTNRLFSESSSSLSDSKDSDYQPPRKRLRP